MYSPADVKCYLPPSLDLWSAHGGLVVADDESPGGNEEGYSLTEPGSGFGEFYIEWDFTSPTTQPYPRIGPFEIVFWAKANGRHWIWVDAGNGGVNRYAYFDLQNGVVGTVSSPENELVATIEALQDGWYRCTLRGVTAGSGASAEVASADMNGVTFGPADADDSFGYTGNGTGVFLYSPSIDCPGYAAY
jgi:hypothetical protein